MTPATVMQPEAAQFAPVHFGFLTLPNFSMIAFTSAVEVLRMTNYVGRASHYRWSVISTDGVPVRASNGVTVTPTRTLEEVGVPDVLIVCGGTQIRSAVDTRVKALLADLGARGVPLGALCTGAYALMSAGLLDDYRCTVHWEDMSALHAEFPRVKFSDELFVIDRDRLTCTGGTALESLAMSEALKPAPSDRSASPARRRTMRRRRAPACAGWPRPTAP